MTDTNLTHAQRVADLAHRSVLAKYTAGQAEHGGWLPGKGGLFGESWAEVTDLIVYLATLHEQLCAIHAAMTEHPQEAASALRLICYGHTSDTLPAVVIKP